MKYFNKTRTIEQKVTDREVLTNLDRQTQLLNAILQELKKLNESKNATYKRFKFLGASYLSENMQYYYLLGITGEFTFSV